MSCLFVSWMWEKRKIWWKKFQNLHDSFVRPVVLYIWSKFLTKNFFESIYEKKGVFVKSRVFCPFFVQIFRSLTLLHMTFAETCRIWLNLTLRQVWTLRNMYFWKYWSKMADFCHFIPLYSVWEWATPPNFDRPYFHHKRRFCDSVKRSNSMTGWTLI